MHVPDAVAHGGGGDAIEIDEGKEADMNIHGEQQVMADGPEGEVQTSKPRIARSPSEPTSRDRELHEVLHIPLRSWCKHCMMGRGKDCYHMRLDGKSEADFPRIGMDYMFLTDRGVTSKSEDVIGECMTLLVVKDFLHKSIWVYPAEGKGVVKSEWISYMLHDDMATCGMDNSMIVVKSDQEPAIKEMQAELAKRRREAGATGTILENSKVGDSSSNGRTERAI